MLSVWKSFGRLSGSRPKVPHMKQKPGQMVMFAICDLRFDSLKYRYGLDVHLFPEVFFLGLLERLRCIVRK